jgi:uncharacterized phage protein gp47/JayE
VDEEGDEALRSRLIKTIQSPPHGGNRADYEMWALEAHAGVKNALCTPTYAGLGSVGVAIWGDAENPVLPDVTVKEVYEYILKMAPVTAGPGLYVYAPTILPINFVIRLIPDSPEVRDAVVAELKDKFAAEGRPGTAIPLTHLAEAVSLAAGEWDHAMLAPTANIEPALEALPVLGEVAFVE